MYAHTHTHTNLTDFTCAATMIHQQLKMLAKELTLPLCVWGMEVSDLRFNIEESQAC